MKNPQKDPGNFTPPPRPRISLFWWLAMLALFAWNIVSLRSQAQQEIAIPYTAFVGQVESGNVKEVEIDGAQISGNFKSGVPATDLLPPDQLATPAPTSQGTDQSSAKSELITGFTTTFPEASTATS